MLSPDPVSCLPSTFQLLTTAQPMSLRRCTLRKSYHLPGKDLDYATPSIKSLRKSAGPQFTCEVCCRMMSSGAKEDHLSSKPHADAVKKQNHEHEREAQKTTDALRKREKIEITAKQDEWTCGVCKRSMKWASRESHLAGALHQDVLERKVSRADTPCNYDATGPNTFWTCDICIRTMPSSSRNTHLSGRPHARTFAEKNSKLKILSLAQAQAQGFGHLPPSLPSAKLLAPTSRRSIPTRQFASTSPQSSWTMYLFGRRHARGVRKREVKKAQQLKKLLQNSTHSKQVGGT